MNGINTGTNSWLSNTALAQKRQNLTPLKPEQPNPADANSTKSVDKVSFSKKLQTALNHGIEHKQGVFIDSKSNDSIIDFGIHVLGGHEQIKKWQAKGLEISKETLQAAAKQFFNHDFKSRHEYAQQHSLSINQVNIQYNPYQIIQDNQSTPDWFEQEKQAYIDSLANSPKVQAAFRNGEQYVLTPTNHKTNDALAAYRIHNRKSATEDEEVENNKRFKLLKEALEHRSINKKEQTDMGSARAEKIEKSYAEKYPDAPNNRVVEGTAINRPTKS